jgi:hypothetical protein
MDAALKSEIQEIVELVKTVPESLQVRTLELLLQDLLDRTSGKKHTRLDENEEESEKRDATKENEKGKNREHESNGLNPQTLPMRLKAFMKRTKVTDKQLERLFHIEGNQYEPIWTLKATKFSKAQVQIALLQSLQRALTSGEFSFDREEVRAECKKKNSYDNTNFKANFQNSGKYFSGLEKDGLVSLTDEGMAVLAALIVELAGEEDVK